MKARIQESALRVTSPKAGTDGDDSVDASQERVEDIAGALQGHFRECIVENGLPRPPRESNKRKSTAKASDVTAMAYVDDGLMADLLNPAEERELLVSHHQAKKHYERALEDDKEKLLPRTRRLHEAMMVYRTRIIGANLRLAKHIARRYAHHGMEYGDLYSAAVTGMLEALDRFDLEHTTKFATYATWWIRQKLQLVVVKENTSNLAALSPHHIQDKATIARFCEGYLHTHGRNPTLEEIAQGVDLSVNMIRTLRATHSPVSLENTFDDTGDAMGKFIADGEQIGTDGQKAAVERRMNPTLADVMVSDQQRAIDDLLGDHLRPREAEIIRLRFLGAPENPGQPLSLREIGQRLRISKERVRQIQNRALQKLRSATRSAGFAGGIVFGKVREE
jgi:RNA polymerase primary sigma factor